MTKEELLNASEEELLQEVRRLQYIFGHSQIIRHGLNRSGEEYQTQSVAEHIYNMMILAQYFHPLEDPESDWDWEKIHRMILWHDAGELETGDIVLHDKNGDDEANELEKINIVKKLIPEKMGETLLEVANGFDKQDSVEARFVKAIDRLEAQIFLLNKNGEAIVYNHIGLNYERALWYQDYSNKVTSEFTCINKVINLVMNKLIQRIYGK